MTDTEFERLIFDLKDSGDLTEAGLATLVNGLDRYRTAQIEEENESLEIMKETLTGDVVGAFKNVRGDADEHGVIFRKCYDWCEGAWWGAEQLRDRMIALIEDL